MTRYHKFCKYCHEEFTSKIMAKQHLTDCAYDEVMMPYDDHEEFTIGVADGFTMGFAEETTHNTDSINYPLDKVELPIESLEDNTHPIYQWLQGGATLEDLGGYTHEIVKPDAKWIFTDKGARKVDFNHEATFTWELTEEDSKRWQEFMKDIKNKITVTWDGYKFLCTYEYDEDTGVLHLEGEEITDE